MIGGDYDAGIIAAVRAVTGQSCDDLSLKEWWQFKACNDKTQGMVDKAKANGMGCS
jgi:hypothetical protein